jgi:hypothetical protein
MTLLPNWKEVSIDMRTCICAIHPYVYSRMRCTVMVWFDEGSRVCPRMHSCALRTIRKHGMAGFTPKKNQLKKSMGWRASHRRNRDTGGPIARTVADVARIFSVTVGYDVADPLTQVSMHGNAGHASSQRCFVSLATRRLLLVSN